MNNKTISVYTKKAVLDDIKKASIIDGRSVNGFITHYSNKKAQEVIKEDDKPE